jgi:hypothetical protein
MNALQRAVSLLHVTVEGRVAITDVTDLEAWQLNPYGIT